MFALTRSRILAGCAIAVALVAVSIAVDVHGSARPAQADQPISIDSSSGETFTPTSQPTSKVGAMTARAALNRFVERTSHRALKTMPSGAEVQYGLLTLANGDPAGNRDTTYEYQNQPVWAYSLPNQCQPMSGAGAEARGTSHVRRHSGCSWMRRMAGCWTKLGSSEPSPAPTLDSCRHRRNALSRRTLGISLVP